MPFAKPKMYKRRRKTHKFLFSKKQAKVIKKIAQSSGELKEKVVTSSSSSVTSGLSLDAGTLFTIAQGDGKDERIGDQIKIRDISGKVSLKCGTTQTNFRLFAIQQLEDVAPTGISASVPQPDEFFPDIQTSLTKYKVLVDKHFSMSSGGQGARTIKWKIPMSKLKIHKLNYDSGASTLTSGGRIYIYLSTDNAIVSQVTAVYSARLRYSDV